MGMFLNHVSTLPFQIFSGLCFLMTLLSIGVFCADTIPEVHRNMTLDHYAELYGVNRTVLLDDFYGGDMEAVERHNHKSGAIPEQSMGSKFNIDNHFRVPNNVLIALDFACLVFFTLEIVLRFIFCPDKCRFFANSFNLFDLISIVPFIVEIVVEQLSATEYFLQSAVDALHIMKIFRMFRILRLFRHYKGLQVLVLTLKHSYKELILLVAIIAVTMVVFASLIFFVNKNDQFSSIPHSFWWAIVTMSTVGYGDSVPDTRMGYLVGALCAISGLLAIAFTVPTVVGNFLTFYAHEQFRKENVIARKKPEDIHGISWAH